MSYLQVGSQGCGKSSLVKMLSILTGNQLNTLAVNSAMDTTELLGGFEQVFSTKQLFLILKMTNSGNIVGKGESAKSQHALLFPMSGSGSTNLIN